MMFKSVSHGTLRPQDLIPTFLATFQALVGDKEYKGFCSTRTLPPANISDEHSWWDTEDASYLLEDLFGVLDAIAPPGFYFGSREGDPTDFGFFAHEEESE